VSKALESNFILKIMRASRSIYRIIFILLFTISIYLVMMSGIALFGFVTKTAVGWRGWILRRWAKGMAWIVGMKIKTIGTPPKPPFYLVSNHVGYMDVIAYLTKLPCIFVSRGDLKKWPVIGFFAWSVNTLFISRKHKKDVIRINKLIEKAMTNQEGLVVFPEGGTTNGASISPFKPPLLEYPAKKELPVSYASVTYKTPQTEKPAHLAVCWWGQAPFFTHFFQLFGMPEFEATIIFGETKIQDNDRKTLAKKLWKAIHQQFIPVVQ